MENLIAIKFMCTCLIILSLSLGVKWLFTYIELKDVNEEIEKLESDKAYYKDKYEQLTVISDANFKISEPCKACMMGTHPKQVEIEHLKQKLGDLKVRYYEAVTKGGKKV